jgi:hypothetical protein
VSYAATGTEQDESRREILTRDGKVLKVVEKNVERMKLKGSQFGRRGSGRERVLRCPPQESHNTTVLSELHDLLQVTPPFRSSDKVNVASSLV